MKTHSSPLYIFDTDMGNDVDDLLAQILLIRGLAATGGEFGAAVVNKGNRLAPAFVDLINRYYDCPGVPIGWCAHGPAPGEASAGENAFMRPVLERLGPDLLDYDPDCKDWPDAVAVLRKTLAGAENHSVIYISIGFATILAELLASPPDEYSPLSGLELVRSKIKFVSMMGGEFGQAARGEPPHREHNIVGDIASAQLVVSMMPVPIYFSGFELGNHFEFPGFKIREAFGEKPDHPLCLSYESFRGFAHNRPLWDLTSVLFALAPEAGYFDLSPPGLVGIGSDAVTHFSATEEGRHRHLKLREENIGKIMGIFVQNCLYYKSPVASGEQVFELCPE